MMIREEETHQPLDYFRRTSSHSSTALHCVSQDRLIDSSHSALSSCVMIREERMVLRGERCEGAARREA